MGVILMDEHAEELEVRRISDRVMSVKLEVEGEMINVISACAPQVGCERVVIGADLSSLVAEGNRRG